MTSHFRRASAFAGAAVIVSAVLTAAPITASASVSGGSARQASPGKATLAQLRIDTLGIRVGQAVTFNLAGTVIAAHRHLRSAELSFGDHSSQKLKTASGTVQHTYRRAGAYVATLTVEDNAGHKSAAKRSVVVGGANHVSLKKTTIRLPASDLSSIVPLGQTQERFTLKPGIRLPRAGQTLLVGQGALVPDGLIAVVSKAVRKSSGSITVTATDGTLGDAYQTLAVVATSKPAKTLQISTSPASPASPTSPASPARPGGGTVPASAVPFTCKTEDGKPIDTEGSVDVVADFSNTHISTTIDLAARIFSFSVIAKPTFSIGVDFKGTAQCQLSGGFGLNIPIPAVPGLVVTVSPYLSLSATGEIQANASWNPAIFIDVARAPGDDQQFIQYSASTSAGASGSASISLQGGISIKVSAAKTAGLEVDAGPIFTASASVSTSGDCVTVTSEIEVEAKLFAQAFGFINAEVILYDGHFFHSTLFSKCSPGSSGSSGSGGASPPQSGGSGGSPGSGHPPYSGPTVRETTGAVAQTWTDYVHAGGTQGPGISANQSVGVVCKTIGFRVLDGNTWWYLIGSTPWNAAYYVSADPFYNNGQTSGELRGTPFVDGNVPDCSNAIGGNPTPVSPPGSPPSGSGKTFAETTGGVTRTFTDFSDAGGTQGSSIPSNATVQITCKVAGFAVADGNTWWYQVASSPWNDTFYASADAFYNDGQISGSLNGTPFVDGNVPTCSNPTPPPPPSTLAETTGGVTHTWTDYTDAGGTQGPSIASNQTVQITCRLPGFKVADGNTWWYQVSSSPWNNGFYASADAFYNNGATSGPLKGTPFVDPAVPVCGSAPGALAETTGGVTHTWADFSDAGGTQGQTIAGQQTVQITCRVTGFKVADGNTWWYRIASSPWSNSFYASADAFYNNGATSGPLRGTPFYDPAVPTC